MALGCGPGSYDVQGLPRSVLLELQIKIKLEQCEQGNLLHFTVHRAIRNIIKRWDFPKIIESPPCIKNSWCV
jgi:hypothetical protein